MTDQKTYERQLSLLLWRALELEKDSLLEAVHELVDAHFSDLVKDNILKNNQLNNLKNVAFTSMSPSKVEGFISNQAQKELKEKSSKHKQQWARNDLYRLLIQKVKSINAADKERVVTRVKNNANRGSIPQTVVDSWFTPERVQEIQITLVREFISQFTTVYGLKAAEQGGAGSAEEER